MQEHWTVSQYKNYKEKKSKYKNKKVIIDGIPFDSQKEGNHYLELKMLEKQGIIRDVGLQTRFELLPPYKKNGKTIRGIYYFADFTYYFNNKLIVEDTKRIQNRSV